MEDLEKRLEEILKFKATAKTEEEKRQADIAIDILTNDVPLMIKVMTVDEKIIELIQRIIKLVKKAI